MTGLRGPAAGASGAAVREPPVPRLEQELLAGGPAELYLRKAWAELEERAEQKGPEVAALWVWGLPAKRLQSLAPELSLREANPARGAVA